MRALYRKAHVKCIAHPHQIGEAIPEHTPPQELRRLHHRYSSDRAVVAAVPDHYRIAVLDRITRLLPSGEPLGGAA